MAQFTIKFGDVLGACDLMREANREINEILQEVQQAVAQATANWDGEALVIYTEKQTEWNTASQEMNNILNRGQTTLLKIVDNYQNTEKNVRGYFDTVGH